MGLLSSFLNSFWQDIGHFIIRSINYSYDFGELSTTQKEGIITCLPKGDKPKEYLKNWRPISLLNNVYKLASAVIASRIKTVLPHIINRDQTGFISGRYIGENIKMLYDLMGYTEKSNIPALLLLIDFEEAFDSVSWSFIHKVLDFFNFGDSIKKWLTIFYTNIKSCIIVNGHTSSWFKLERGCRQGDPLSPYIFILCAEILANMIRKNKDIKGIKIKNKKYLISQYADDTSLILEATEKALKTALNLISYYAKFSGLSMNIDKTRVIWIGSMKGSGMKLCEDINLNWSQDNFTVLGITFSTNLMDMIDLNYTKKIREMKNTLIQWSKRNLTPFGKITVLKTLVVSKINHLLLALPNPPDIVLKEINTLFFNFIWNNSRDRIKRKISIKDYKDGGLRMIDIFTFVNALKITWIRRFLTNDSQKWGNILSTQCPDIIDFLKFGIDFIKGKLNRLNSFWKDVFKAWVTLVNKQKVESSEEFLKEPLWYNPKFKMGNRSIIIKNMFEAGITVVNDLIKEDGTVLSYNEFVNKYDIDINFLEYNGLVLTVMQYRRRNNIPVIVENISMPIMPVIIEVITRDKKGCRTIYQYLSCNDCVPTARQKWEREFRDIDEKSWERIYLLTHKLTSCTYSKWFQLRILHRIISTNKFLFNINVKDSNKCSFCNVETETTIHLFYECAVVRVFWNTFFQWLRGECPHLLNLNPTCKDIIFGILHLKPTDRVVNLFILLGKQFIYKCRMNNGILRIQQFKSFIKAVYDTEKYVAFKNCSWNKFNKKWSQYKNMMSHI